MSSNHSNSHHGHTSHASSHANRRKGHRHSNHDSSYTTEYYFPTLPLSLDEIYDRAAKFTDKLLARPIFGAEDSDEEAGDSVAALPSSFHQSSLINSRKRQSIAPNGNHGNERSSSWPRNPDSSPGGKRSLHPEGPRRMSVVPNIGGIPGGGHHHGSEVDSGISGHTRHGSLLQQTEIDRYS